MVIVVLLTQGLPLSVPAPAAAADPSVNLLDNWLAQQAQIRTWSAQVLQIRKLKSLARPLEAAGRVWFRQPNRFRWQLGDPPRTIAVRTADALTVIYPKLKQAERFPISGVSDPAWKQVLTLLEVGFPSDKETFYSRYDLIAAEQVDDTLHFELKPADKAARRLLKRLRLEVSAADYILLATELVFPDGSTMRNQFSNHQLNPTLDEKLFQVDLDEDYRIVEPLQP
jgi:outer membrane lipoprotein-sorting protein